MDEKTKKLVNAVKWVIADVNIKAPEQRLHLLSTTWIPYLEEALEEFNEN